MFGSSQIFTMGSTQGTAAAEVRKPRQEEKQSCLPVTVRAIEVATVGKPDEVLIHGTEPSILIIVGVVEDLTQQAACTEFVLNDGTGRIRAKYFASGSENAFSGIESGQYVSLAAQLRTTPDGAAYLSVTTARAVRVADEISYHMIECAHSMLKLQRGNVEPVTPEKKKVSLPEADLKSSSKMPVDTDAGIVAPPVAVSAPALAKAPLTGEAVVKFLQGHQTPEGTSLDQIRAHFSSDAASEVSALVQKLADTGDVYNTIDDNHFSVI